MKTVVRVLVVLAVAAAIVSLTVVVVNITGTSASQLGEGRQSRGGADLDTGPSDLGFARGEGQHRGEGGVEGGVFSMTETVKNIVIIVLIVAVIAALERLLKAVRRKRSARVLVSAGLTDRKE